MEVYNELGLTSLCNRRTFHCLYEIKNNLLPGYLKNEIPEDIPHLHDTRHHGDIPHLHDTRHHGDIPHLHDTRHHDGDIPHLHDTRHHGDS